MEHDTTLIHEAFPNAVTTINESKYWSKVQAAKTRVFTDWKTDDVEPEPTERCTDEACGSPSCRMARMDGHPERCEINHAQWKAFNRRVLAVWRPRLRAILSTYYRVPAETINLRFSVKAGCGCGCSPGWIIDGPGIQRGRCLSFHTESLEEVDA